MTYVSGFLQWLHVMAAVLAVGGVFFMRFILYPAMHGQGIDAESRSTVASRILPRFRMMIHTCIAVLLATGTYRFIRQLPKLKDWTEYHAIFGIKVLLSLVVFGIAIALTMPPAANPNAIQRKREKWMLVNFVLGALVVLLSAYLRRLWDVPR